MLSIRNFKHIIFDFDGVLINSEKTKFENLKKILQQRGYQLSATQFHSFIGKKRGQFLKEIGFEKTDEIMQKVHDADKAMGKIPLVDGVVEFLSFLQKQNKKMHIATGSNLDFVKKQLRQHNIYDFFSEIITGEVVTTSKPDPAIYLFVKQKLKSDSILVIEDSPAGVQSAKSAGLPVISLLENPDADRCIKCFDELIQ